MTMKEWMVVPLIALFMLVSLTAYASEATQNNEFVSYANHENMSEASRDYLINCLNDREIEVKVDREKNILIQERDMKVAVASCS